MTGAVEAGVAREIRETLSDLEELFRGGPDALRYFLDLQRKSFEPAPHPGTPPVIGAFCIHVPEEIVRALGATLVRFCSGSCTLATAGAELLPARSCAVARASAGMLLRFERAAGRGPDLVIVPTTCDQRRKSHDLLKDAGFNVYALEVPPGKDSEEARRYWRHSVKNLVVELEKVTGARLTRKRLGHAMAEANRARSEYRKLHRLLESAPSPMHGTGSLLVSGSRFLAEAEEWTRALARLNRELEQRVREGKTLRAGTPRVLLTGSPVVFPNFKVPLLIENSGAVIAADELCTSSRLLWDAGAYDEAGLYEMVPSVADRCLKPCTCPFLVSNDDRQRRILELARRSEIDGIVYQVSSGCAPFELEFRVTAGTARGENLPVLYLETDYGPEDTGQLSTRVEAFVESLWNRRSG